MVDKSSLFLNRRAGCVSIKKQLIVFVSKSISIYRGINSNSQYRSTFGYK